MAALRKMRLKTLLLTLVGTPVVYSIFDDWEQYPLWTKLGLKKKSAPEGPVAA